MAGPREALSEAELISQCRRGDRAAQHELYVRTSDAVFRLLVRLTRDEHAAFDLAHDAYILAFSRIAEFNGASSIRTWIHRIALNGALQYLRRRKLHRVDDGVSLSDMPGPSNRDAEALHVDVDEALERLSLLDQTILILRYQQGLGHDEIAEIMDCPCGTVRSRLRRASERMRRLMRAYGGAEGPAGAAPALREVSDCDDKAHGS